MAAKNKKIKKRSWREFWGLVWLRMQEVRVKVGVFIFMVVYVCLLIRSTYNEFRCDDPIPPVETISVQMRKKYRDLAAKIRTGIYIKNFSVFSFTNNQFLIDAVVWFEFKKNEVRQETIDKFSFENARIISKSSPIIKFENDNVLIKYNLILDCKTFLNYKQFPLQDHRLSLILVNNFASPNEVYFNDEIDSVSIKLAKNLFTSHWKVYNFRKFVGYSRISFDKYRQTRSILHAKAVFTIDFARTGIKNLLIIFIPIFAAVFLSIFTFMMSFNNYIGKFSLSVTSITALLGYRFVIEQVVPKVGYLTMVDKLYIFFLFLCFVIFIFQLLLVRQYLFLVEQSKKTKAEILEADVVAYSPKQTEIINLKMFFCICFIFLFFVTFIVLF